MNTNDDWLSEDLSDSSDSSNVEDEVETVRPVREDIRAGGRDAFVAQRLHALDAYRGAIMISLAFGGFGLAATASQQLQQQPDSAIWRQVAFHFEHVPWVGCSFWDLIQPSFMFMVGVAAAYSYAKRRRLGHSSWRIFLHSLWRSLVLVLLGIFLISDGGDSTSWSLTNVLSQIGLGYTFLFLCWTCSRRTQVAVALLVLVGVWAAYRFYPTEGINPHFGAPEAGVSSDWAKEHLRGVQSAWHKNVNLGHALDQWLLNQIPRDEPFQYNDGGYATLNFLPSLITMLFGLMAGGLLRSSRSSFVKLLWLILAGALGVAVGWSLDHYGICPLVKRIWTPSWTIFSGGCCLLLLAFFFATIDLIHFRYWAIPLTVVGMNSLAVYVMSMLLKPWVAKSLVTHLGDQVFRLRVRWGADLYRFWFMDEAREATLAIYEPTVRAVIIGLVFWLIALWMYRQRVFVRI